MPVLKCSGVFQAASVHACNYLQSYKQFLSLDSDKDCHRSMCSAVYRSLVVYSLSFSFLYTEP